MPRHSSTDSSSLSATIRRFITWPLRAGVSFVRASSPPDDQNGPPLPSMTDNSCVSCGATGQFWQFEDVVSGDTICLECGTVNDTSGQFFTDAQRLPDKSDNSLDPDCVIAEAETGIVSPVMLQAVTETDKISHGCTFRMFDRPFDVMAKKCDLMEGLINRRSLIAMRAACERVGVMCPEFTLTHNPGVQAAAAYVVATHPPGIDRGRTRLLKEPQNVTGLPGICAELGITVSSVARCVRTYGDRLHASMKDARRMRILPEFDHQTAAEKKARLRPKRRTGAGKQ